MFHNKFLKMRKMQASFIFLQFTRTLFAECLAKKQSYMRRSKKRVGLSIATATTVLTLIPDQPHVLQEYDRHALSRQDVTENKSFIR